ncbi:MAG: endopeptidase La [Deltaproteobacteria bacterium 13_1_40CM_4_54_4]|nr:MAG: endopeptidase La [Deltaproteobacteria bacterium 13_1_40CM_4_54_4]
MSEPEWKVESSENRGSQVEIPDVLPLLPIRDIVIYPYMMLPLFVGRDVSIRAVEESLSRDRLIFLVAQKNSAEENPNAAAIHRVGTIASIMRMLKLADGRVKILVQGLSKGEIDTCLRERPFFEVKIRKVIEPTLPEVPIEVEALMRTAKEKIEQILNLKNLPPEIVMVTDNISDPGVLADLVASNLRLKIEESQAILEIFDPIERLKKVNELLTRELELSTMQARIQNQAKEEMSKTQRDYFLREQLKQIQQELGEGDERAEELSELKKQIEKAKMPTEAKREADKQLRRLEQMHPESSEASLVRTYLDWLVDLPWSKKTKDNLNIKKAKQVLDEDHYNLEKIKERILEYLAVNKLRRKIKGPILCFVGPPGVGKTSLGRSIARALGRNCVRVSLGGVRDEAEIRGHRRTYVGALPGRIIQGVKQAGSNNPVFMLDEIDKVGADFRGDPSAALLEVLDPEQNHTFSDHYLNLPFDLSNVLFICTANLLDPVPAALADRMEVIQLSGYTNEEKLEIARKYLIPRQLEDNGISTKHLELSDDAVLRIIAEYTKEAGLRNLEREIASICRKVARKVAEGKRELTRITRANIHSFLGVPKFLPEAEQEHHEIGVATGLAWTSTGGEVLYVEASLSKGRGNLTLTGQLGDVMKESAQAAVSYARAHAAKLGIEEDFYQKLDIHIHVPAGAIPKDGPSAGITMATALISALTKRPVSRDVAMTGEITLRGRVLPIGGLKEKCLAAFRAGIKTVIVPDRNKKDLDEIPKPLRRKLHWVIAENMSDVLQIALLDRQNGARKTKHVSAPKTKSRKGKSLKRERPLRKNHRERSIPLRP